MRVMIDTCIIIDEIHKREPFWPEAHEIVRLCAGGAVEGCISAKSIADIYYLAHKSLHSDRATRKVIRDLTKLFHISDTTAADCINALESCIADYEDALLIETARREKTDCIVTRNTSDYQKAGLPVYTPAEFLALMRG